MDLCGFSSTVERATVIPIPKPNKDPTDPLSYRPIALTSCLCKVLERMINTRFIWYLEKYKKLDRSQSGFRKHRSTTYHLVSLERYLRDAFAQRQQAVGLFFDLEKAYETTWQYGIIRDLHRIGLRGRLPVFVSKFLRDHRIRVRIGTILSDEFYPEEGVPTGGVLAVTCFGLKINELPSCIARDIFRALFVDDLAICFRGRSLDTIERHLQQAVNAIQEWATRNCFKFAAQKCKVIHFTAPRSRVHRPPAIRIGNTFLPVEESTEFLGLWWDSRLSFKKHISVLKTQCREALNLVRVVAHLKWRGDRDTLLMLYRAIVRSKLDYGCIVFGTTSNTNLRQLDSIHNSGLRLALGAFCTSPISSLYTEANETPLEERRLKLSMHCYLKTRACVDNPAYHALHEFDRTTRDLHTPPPTKYERRHDPTSGPCYSSQDRGSHGLRRDQCRIGLPPGDTQLSTRNARLRPQETRPHWRSEQMYDPQMDPHKDHMMTFTQMAPKWMREWGRQRSSTVISRMVRQPAANCPKDCKTIAPSVLLRLQPSLWHWTITDTWVQFITM